ncbi:hypothetical protein HOH87_00240 [bacterium]|jgi:hypothetical protein|nr:hypothetical protein [bacterium]
MASQVSASYKERHSAPLKKGPEIQIPTDVPSRPTLERSPKYHRVGTTLSDVLNGSHGDNNTHNGIQASDRENVDPLHSYVSATTQDGVTPHKPCSLHGRDSAFKPFLQQRTNNN